MGLEEGKDLVNETIKAFKAGLKGNKYDNPYVPPEDQSSSQISRFDAIEKLHQLHESGALTDEEFNREKSRILSTE